MIFLKILHPKILNLYVQKNPKLVLNLIKNLNKIQFLAKIQVKNPVKKQSLNILKIYQIKSQNHKIQSQKIFLKIKTIHNL